MGLEVFVARPPPGNPIEYCVLLIVRQIFRPLVFRKVGRYGGYFGGRPGGAVTMSIYEPELDPTTYVPIGQGGVQVGSVSNHTSASTIFLNPDGTYDARDAAGTVVVPAAPLADVIVAVAGSPGTSMKLEVKPIAPASATVPAADGSLTFLSTSVGAEVVIPVPATRTVYQVAVPAPLPPGFQMVNYSVPDRAALVTAIKALGPDVQEFTRPLLRLRSEGIEIGRAFDDAGLRRLRLLADHTFAITDAAGATLGAAADLPDVLLEGSLPLGGRQGFPAWLVSGDHRVTLYGLARGGTAVLDRAAEQVIDAAGAVFGVPAVAELRDWMVRHGVRFSEHNG
jgi:hypothetical protein